MVFDRRQFVPHEIHDLPAFEVEICKNIEERSKVKEREDGYSELALEADTPSLELASDPLQNPPSIGSPPPRSLDAFCEWLADYYSQAGEGLLTQSGRDRVRTLAQIAIKRLAAVRKFERGPS